MTENSRKIWTKLEENIGRCILFRDAALKEVLGNETFTLQFATLSVPEKVETFLDNAEGIRADEHFLRFKKREKRILCTFAEQVYKLCRAFSICF